MRKLGIHAELYHATREFVCSQLGDASTTVTPKQIDELCYQAAKGIQRVNNRADRAARKAAKKAGSKC